MDDMAAGEIPAAFFQDVRGGVSAAFFADSKIFATFIPITVILLGRPL